MRLGRVTGRLWSTIKSQDYDGQRFLVVQPIDHERQDVGEPLICLDSVGAGAGETIYWVRGKEAALAFHPQEVASDATIVGIVDKITPHDSAADDSDGD